MGWIFYFLTRSKDRDFLGASAELAGDWRMRYVMIRVSNFQAGMGWRYHRPTTGFSMQDVRNLEKVEPFDLKAVTSAMLEKEGLWKRVSESAVVGEAEDSFFYFNSLE